MQIFNGLSIAGGMAAGPIWKLRKTDEAERAALSPEEEKARFEAASEQAKADLSEIYEKTLELYGEENAAVFEIHGMLIEDDDFRDAVFEGIDDGLEASVAVKSAGDACAAVFEAIDDEYTRERAGDFRDIAARICDVLSGNAALCPDEPSIIYAEELTPGQTVKFPRERILGFVTEKGSLNSHAGILARNFGIPAVSGIVLDSVPDGSTVAVDGNKGVVWIDPEEALLSEITSVVRAENEAAEKRRALKNLPSVTRDGRSIRVCANMGNLSDLEAVAESGAEGVGLFRSEFLYLSREDYPGEDELYEAYKKTAEALGERPLIIRTLDIGADKQADYFHMDPEENPALGLRAIRLCLERPELFKTQLRAILRATPFGNIGIMFPMIISVSEVKRLKAALAEAKAELEAENVPVGQYETGIMIETPAAALVSDELAEEVDFFSIGTNDLSQYTLAIDRQNPHLDGFFDPHHPAILRLIELTVKNGHKGGCWVGICGELGADESLTDFFLDIGVDELSVSPAKLLRLREHIREEV